MKKPHSYSCPVPDCEICRLYKLMAKLKERGSLTPDETAELETVLPVVIGGLALFGTLLAIAGSESEPEVNIRPGCGTDRPKNWSTAFGA